MSTDNGIKVSRGYTLPDDDGTPNAEEITTFRTSFLSGRACVVAWEDHFKALEADAKAWRERRARELDVMPTSMKGEAREPKIKTPCPSCGSQSLFVSEHGLLTCSVIGCREPAMLNDMAIERRKQMESSFPSVGENASETVAPWVPKVGERVTSLTGPHRWQCGTVNAPPIHEPTGAILVAAKMDSGDVVVNGIQYWQPTREPTGPEGHVEVLSIEQRIHDLESQCRVLRADGRNLENQLDGQSLTIGDLREKLAAVEMERDEARANIAAPALAKAVEERDRVIHQLAETLEDYANLNPERFGLELVGGKWRIRET